MLLETVRKTIEEHHLLKKGDKVLCAVSGGADSVCLLNVMCELKSEYDLSIFVVNVNHLIRGDEAERDSSFVKSLCKQMGIECFYREYDVKKIAKELKLGEEECGRSLRYNCFAEIANALGGAKIATAHNLNDNAETVLFRMIRGSSARGLSGIKYKRDNIIRPLLDVPRSEIENYLTGNNILWCEDSTNKQAVYNRNRLRLHVMPELEKISSGAQEKIVSAAQLISEDEEYLDIITQQVLKEFFFHGTLFYKKINELHMSIKRRVAAKVLKEWGAQEITKEKTERFLSLFDAENGKRFDINAELYAEKSYDKIRCEKRCETKEFSAILDAENAVSDGNWVITAEYSEKMPKRKSNNLAIFDAEKLVLPLKVRYRKDGDRISPTGMKGTKKISDILTDAKVTRSKRDFIPIVEKDNEIVYIGGIRQTSLYEPDNNTKKHLILKYTEEKIQFERAEIENVKYQ